MTNLPPRPLAIVDLDGVVADVRHRLHHVAGRPKDWDAFFAGIPDDPLLAEGLAVAQRLAGDHDVIYVTGRPEHTRGATQGWLDRNGLPAGRLVMRRAGDRRPARVTKPQLVRRLATGRRVGVVVDDDPEVCAAMAAAGWPVLRADWMAADADARDTLHVAQERRGRS